MSHIIVGVLIGISTSFIAGVVLMWKGERIIERLRRLPARRRVKVFSRAYLLALRGYPYRFLHAQGLGALASLWFLMVIVYGLLTYVGFRVDLTNPDVPPREAMKEALAPLAQILDSLATPWMFLLVTVFLIVVGIRLIFVKILPEFLVPMAYHELNRLRECVAKCGTKKQFLEFADLEHQVRDRESLTTLIMQAQRIVGDDQLDLINEILWGISETDSHPETD